MNRLPHLTAVLAAFLLSLGATAQESCPNLFDTNDNNTVDIEDFLAILGLFADNDLDDDGVWDSQDLCTDLEACNYEAIPSEPCGYIDALGLCGGGCEGDGDGDGICDSEDNCVGVYDECGVCNGPGPTEVVIDGITILYDSVYAEQIDTWFVFEVGADTAFSYICSGFECESPNWVQQGQDIDGLEGEQMGRKAVISDDGTTVALSSTTMNNSTGFVRVYSWDSSSWVQKGETLYGEAEGDEFGYSIALSQDGNTLVVGAPFNDHDSFNNPGKVKAYSWTGTSWEQIGEDITGDIDGDWCGYSVAMASTNFIIAVGDRNYDGIAGGNTGRVRVFSWEGDEYGWIQLGDDIEGANVNDRFGSSVALSGDGYTLVSGSLLADSPNGNNTGHVRAFHYGSGSWTQLGNTIHGDTEDGLFGSLVALSGNGLTLITGSPLYDDNNVVNTGLAEVHSFNGANWVQVGERFVGNQGTRVGSSVSISFDGSIIAIGAIFAGSSGSASVYKREGNSWIPFGVTIYGEESQDHSGEAVCLSADGTKLVVGAPQNDGGGQFSGHAKVYDLECE